MRYEWKGWLRLGVTLFVLYLAIHYWGSLSHLGLVALSAAFPLLVGAAIAYAVNILMSFYEQMLLPNASRPKVLLLRRLGQPLRLRLRQSGRESLPIWKICAGGIRKFW